jgi:hypothetical protein
LFSSYLGINLESIKKEVERTLLTEESQLASSVSNHSNLSNEPTLLVEVEKEPIMMEEEEVLDVNPIVIAQKDQEESDEEEEGMIVEHY